MAKNGGYEFEILRNYDVLQRIARNPRYLELCQELSFDENGFADPPAFSTHPHFDRINEEFGLTSAINPKIIVQNKYRPEFFSQIPIFKKDPFACTLIFQRWEENGRIISSPVHNNHYIIMNIDLLAPIKAIRSAVKEYLDTYREQIPMMGQKDTDGPSCECLHVEVEQARFRIDMLSFESDIFGEIEKHISPTKGRIHFDKRTGCYAVWDLRKDQDPFRRIALRFRLTEDQTRKRFRRAFTLITGEEYEGAIWQVWVCEHLHKRTKVTNGKAREEALKKLAKFEKVSRKKRLIETTSTKRKPADWIEKSVQTTSLEGNPRTMAIFRDAISFCRNEKKCGDEDCKRRLQLAVKSMDFNDFDGCPDIYQYMREALTGS